MGGGQARLHLILGTIDRVVHLVQAYLPQTVTHHAVEPHYQVDGRSGSGSGGGGSSSSRKDVTTADGTADDGAIVPMLNLLGNNDMDGNYVLPVAAAGTDSPCVSSIAPFFFRSLRPNQSATFRQGGFYEQKVLPGVHVLSLNTVIYSPRHRPSNVTLADPFGQRA